VRKTSLNLTIEKNMPSLMSFPGVILKTQNEGGKRKKKREKLPEVNLREEGSRIG